MVDSNNPWHSRGYLPHFDLPGLIQSVTFRLHDSLPAAVIGEWRRELNWREGLSSLDPREVRLRSLIAKYEDAGHGACWLQLNPIAALVESALLHDDGVGYRLLAWCVMPNHVHVLVETCEGWPLTKVVQAWKSFTAHRANQILERQGVFWARDYHDRFIRDESHLFAAVRYIEGNPLKAGFVGRVEDWKFGSAHHRVGT